MGAGLNAIIFDDSGFKVEFDIWMMSSRISQKRCKLSILQHTIIDHRKYRLPKMCQKTGSRRWKFCARRTENRRLHFFYFFYFLNFIILLGMQPDRAVVRECQHQLSFFFGYIIISRRHIGVLMRDLEWRWRITCRYRSRDQNCNFRKFKMADGRHFEIIIIIIHTLSASELSLRRQQENSIIFISQLWVIGFRSKLADAHFISQDGHLTTTKSKFCKLKMADGRHFENCFISISQPWIIRFRWSLVRWCRFKFPGWVFLTKIEILQIQDGGRSPYWKSYFGYISAPYWPIKAKFGVEMKNHMRI